MTEHSERVEDILAVGVRLVESKNAHAAQVTERSNELKAKVAQVDEFAKAQRTKYVGS